MLKNQNCADDRCLFNCSGDHSLCKASKTITRETREGEGLWERCEHCGLVINRGGVDPDEASVFYNETYTRDNSFDRGKVLSPKEHFEARINTMRERADYLREWLETHYRVFELGAGTGELLYLIKEYVGSCVANELNDRYSKFIQSEIGIESSSSNFLNLKFKEKFDIIISLYTIDHIYDTIGVVRKIAFDLKKNGYFYVEVPNDDQALRTFLPEPQRSSFEKFMYQKAHYYSFSRETLRRLLTENGFKIIHERCRHDYTLNNYLHWYFRGEPMKKLKKAKENTDIHEGQSSFEIEMNELFSLFNNKFREIISRNWLGESLCVMAQKI